jgi:hypothetical protein
MSMTPEEIKTAYQGRRCFNKRTGKIGYLAADKIKKASGFLCCFNVEVGKLDSAGKKLMVEEKWNIMDVTIMEFKK